MPGKLTYFPLGTRAECIRALCFLANHPYEDKRITFEEFADVKHEFPLQQVPVWEEDGMVLCQSSAILRALGIRFGYYSTDPKVMWEIDSLLDFMEEGYPKAVGLGFKAMKNIEPTEEDMEQWE